MGWGDGTFLIFGFSGGAPLTPGTQVREFLLNNYIIIAADMLFHGSFALPAEDLNLVIHNACACDQNLAKAPSRLKRQCLESCESPPQH